MKRIRTTFVTLALVALIGTVPAVAQESALFDVTVTNLTRGQIFSPPVVVTHTDQISLFEAEGMTVVQFGQGFASMSSPMKELEKLIISGQLAHGGNPVLTWMAGNLVASEDAAGNIKPDKGKSTEKIDGMVALIMGLDRAVRRQTQARSVYEENDLLVM